jgi:acid phosphatase
LDPESYPTTPESLELQQVHVYVRHGERTPVGVRMAGPPASIPQHWMMCKTARWFRAAVFSDTHNATPLDIAGGEKMLEDTLLMRKTVERADGTAAEGEWYA